MKYKEQKIASFQDELHRWQLIKMTYESNQVCHYQIRKDRKVICNVKWEGEAKHKFANIISMSLNQLHLFRYYGLSE